ncbi:MAG: metal ABC transporter ATP-binding protein [bacterium]
MNRALSVSNLNVTLNGKRILEDVNFEVMDNEIISILGPNGSGKTTLLRAILGLEAIESGSIQFFGGNISQSRRKIGYVPQFIDRVLDFPITVSEAVLSGRYSAPFRRYSKEDYKITNEHLKRFSLYDMREKRLQQLSGGEVQRVMMARAIVGEPKLLLLDEPTSSVDSKSQTGFYGLLKELRKSMAIILVTHDLGAVSTNIERIICLNKKINYDGPAENGLSRLNETYKGSINIINHNHHNEDV